MPSFDEMLLLSDERFFGLLDLGREGLEAVGAAVAAGDFETARPALMRYFHQLADTPFGALPPMDERTDAPSTADGEAALRHQFSNWGQTAQLPEQIPWLRPELAHPSRGDLTQDEIRHTVFWQCASAANVVLPTLARSAFATGVALQTPDASEGFQQMFAPDRQVFDNP